MKIICFDMDDTLVKSIKVHVEAFNRAFALNGLRRVGGKEIHDLFGLEGEKIIKGLFPKLSRGKTAKVLKDHNRIVVKETAKHARPIRGARGVLKKLKRDYKLALVSNSSEKEILATLKAAKIDIKLFDTIVGNDEVRHGKPSADELNLAKKITKCREGFMVGDSPYDVRAGRAAKLRTIAVTTGNYSHGTLSREKPSIILKSIAEIPKAIKDLGW